MTTFGMMYLGLVLGGFAVFSAALAYVTFAHGNSPRE